jgi:hypothetical protein
MRRRDLLNFGLFGALAATAGTGFLKIYRHRTGVKKIFEFPDPILRKISSPVDAMDDKIILNGILFIDYEHAGLDT